MNKIRRRGIQISKPQDYQDYKDQGPSIVIHSEVPHKDAGCRANALGATGLYWDLALTPGSAAAGWDWLTDGFHEACAGDESKNQLQSPFFSREPRPRVTL